MTKLVVLTGAGISAESGIKTFRDNNGLWEEYDVQKVASIDGWYEDPKLVLQFYNARRQQLAKAQPNEAHYILSDLQNNFDVQIITQNVDNLHERSDSKNVLHLHGELTKVRSVNNESLVYDIGYEDIAWGDTAEDKGQLRPHIVWFGEAVPMMNIAVDRVQKADIFAVVGTSLNVYPAAGLVDYVKPNIPLFLIDPNNVGFHHPQLTVFQEKASVGMAKMREALHKLKE